MAVMMTTQCIQLQRTFRKAMTQTRGSKAMRQPRHLGRESMANRRTTRLRLRLQFKALRLLTRLHPQPLLQAKVGTTYRHLEMLMLLLLLKMAAVARDG